MSPRAGEVFRFSAVGLAQNGLNVAIFALVNATGAKPQAAAAVAGVVALVFSFVLNRSWTFRGHNGAPAAQGRRYLAVYTASVLLGIVILHVLTELTRLPDVVAQVVSIAAVAPTSYLAQRHLTFGTPTQSALPGDG